MPLSLTLICPYLLTRLQESQSRDESWAQWPALQRWLERAVMATPENDDAPRSNSRLMSWQIELLTALALDCEGPNYASAPVSWLGEARERRPGICLHVTPVHFIAGMDHVQLADIPELDAEESNELYLSLQQLNTAEFEFAKSPGGHWYLFMEETLGTETHSVEHARRSRLDEVMPDGPGGRRLRRVMTEAQMVLHDHPINRARSRHRQLEVNAVWVWGGGVFANPTPRALPTIFADDAYARGLAMLHQSSWQPAAKDAVELLARLQHDTVAVVNLTTLDELEQRWIAPFMNDRHNDIEARLVVRGRTLRWTRGWFQMLKRKRSLGDLLN